MTKFVEHFQGLHIMQDDDGFWAANGSDFAADNAETVEDARAQIEDYWREIEGTVARVVTRWEAVA